MNTGKIVNLTEYLDEDGYLNDAGLKAIEEWPINGLDMLLDRVKPVWKYHNCGYWTQRDKGIYRIATGGWSGNEAIASALERNVIWWHFWWVLSKRGGLYLFQHPDERRKQIFKNATR